MKMEQDIIDSYQQRANFAHNEAQTYKRLIDTYSLLRLGVFALLILAVYVGINQDSFDIIAVAFVLLFAAFSWLIFRQSKFEKQKEYLLNLKNINENEIDSIQRRGNIYDNGQRFINEKHHYTSDLDIFGNASLFQLINRAATSKGKEKLAGWLSDPADKEVILSRQQAVKELTAKSEWKADIQARLLFANNTHTDQLNTLFTYLHVPLHLPGEKWLRKYMAAAPFLLLTSIIAGYFVPVAFLAAIIIAAFNLIIMASNASYMAKSGAIADKIGSILANYAAVFHTIEKAEWQSPACSDLSEQLKVKQVAKRIEKLSVLVNKLGYNLIMFVGFILNVFMLWTLKQIIAIEDWRRENTENLESAFDVIAELEALVSLSSVNENYPGWCFPEIVNSPHYTISAYELAHPLIDIKISVKNNYQLNNKRGIEIITGSNMAGKSTFLRTIGINTVMALCGAPVCADEMQVSVFTIITYMRVKDSLNENTSTFKAQLNRLKAVLTAVDTGQKVFFLIDEMLSGTNSADKYQGSKAVIEQLISKKAAGMVATHDLQISQLEDKYPDYVRNFYFDIQVIDGEMKFDYKIKNGACRTFNALLLLKQIGIEVDELG
ncbi:MAG: DNA mismatch repair protein MutS [Sphingobacteriaceae bacterium]|nr:MAG: DNA mismatch repair protein MutS [Sphingobacteriaceae bacterium]